MLGKYPVRVMPSKTAIVPVNTSFLPRTQEELERCARTVYIANIDKKVDREDVRVFFQTMCGEFAASYCHAVPILWLINVPVCTLTLLIAHFASPCIPFARTESF